MGLDSKTKNGKVEERISIYWRFSICCSYYIANHKRIHLLSVQNAHTDTDTPRNIHSQCQRQHVFMNKKSSFQANTLKNVEYFYAIFYRLKRSILKLNEHRDHNGALTTRIMITMHENWMRNWTLITKIAYRVLRFVCVCVFKHGARNT